MKNIIRSTAVVLLIVLIGVLAVSCIQTPEDKAASQLEYELNEDGESYSIVGIGSFTGSELVIPEEYNGKPVNTIFVSAFKGCNNLVKVEMPDTILYIEAEAFANCKSLTEIKIPNSVKVLSHGLFSGCSALKSVTLPDSVDEVEQNIFANCTSLKNVTLPSNIKAVSGNMFKNCSALESIVIPDGVEKIQVFAFSGCSSLKIVDMPSSVTLIEFRAFESCSALELIEFHGYSYEWDNIEKRRDWCIGCASFSVNSNKSGTNLDIEG